MLFRSRNIYIYVEEPTIALDATKSTNNFIESNLYVGPLKYSGDGFKKHTGKFDRTLWYDAEDENWSKLIEFVKDKKVMLDGKKISVLEIIGYN